MTVTIRTAAPSDIDTMVDLLLADAETRLTRDEALWKPLANARDRVASTLTTAMTQDAPPFRQQWLLAMVDGATVGITHSILLPVPPIYAGDNGPPGLIMEDCFVRDDAPAGTRAALLRAAENDLAGAGATLFLGSSVVDGPWEDTFAAGNYAPLTLYFAKSGLYPGQPPAGVSAAAVDDVPDIVTSSAANRQVLYHLDPFWKPHDDADARFGAWMGKSLTLPDRDMFVARSSRGFDGYAVSQPATPLHFPAAHDIGGVGFIDDYFHADFGDPNELADAGSGATDLLLAAEAALQARRNATALIVCPAAWTSKISVLERAGYRTAIRWFLKK